MPPRKYAGGLQDFLQWWIREASKNKSNLGNISSISVPLLCLKGGGEWKPWARNISQVNHFIFLESPLRHSSLPCTRQQESVRICQLWAGLVLQGGSFQLWRFLFIFYPKCSQDHLQTKTTPWMQNAETIIHVLQGLPEMHEDGGGEGAGLQVPPRPALLRPPEVPVPGWRGLLLRACLCLQSVHLSCPFKE